MRSSTTTPRLTTSPADSARAAFGRMPAATRHRSALRVLPLDSSTASTHSVPSMRRASICGRILTPRSLIICHSKRAAWTVELSRKRPARKIKNKHANVQLTHAVGSLKALQASTHHDRRATASTPDVLLKLHGVVDRAHHEDASQAETLNCRHERKRTCCQKQAIVGNGLAVLREYLTMDRVDPACRDSAPVIDASDVSPVTGHEVKLADGGTRPT